MSAWKLGLYYYYGENEGVGKMRVQISFLTFLKIMYKTKL